MALWLLCGAWDQLEFQFFEGAVFHIMQSAALPEQIGSLVNSLIKETQMK